VHFIFAVNEGVYTEERVKASKSSKLPKEIKI
jgi:hypothetical protein